MASILDAGLVSVGTGFFIFLLVYALVYGLLSWQKWFGDKQFLYAIIALVIGLISAISPPLRKLITLLTPWYIGFFLVLFFILFIVTLFGVSPAGDFPKIIAQPRVYIWIVIIGVIIALFGVGITFGPSLTPGGAQPVQPAPYAGYDVIGGQYAQPGQLAPQQIPGVATGPIVPGEPGSTATNDFGTNLMNTLFHPKVLGLIAFFILAAVTVALLSMPSS